MPGVLSDPSSGNRIEKVRFTYVDPELEAMARLPVIQRFPAATDESMRARFQV